MKLLQAMEVLQKRPLTATEAAQLSDFQRLYLIDDDDPLIVVLALMAQSQLSVQTLPDLLQQKAIETIELHRTLLREQSVVIAKELIHTLSGQIRDANRTWQSRWSRYLGFFLGGAITMEILVQIFRHIPN